MSKTEKVLEDFLTELLDEYGVDITIRSLSSLYQVDDKGDDCGTEKLTGWQKRAVSSMRELRGSSKTSKVDETWQKYIENVFQITQNDITPLTVKKVTPVKVRD